MYDVCSVASDLSTEARMWAVLDSRDAKVRPPSLALYDAPPVGVLRLPGATCIRREQGSTDATCLQLLLPADAAGAGGGRYLGRRMVPAPSSKKNEAAHRKDLIHAQKGVSLRVPEAIELVDAVMNGRAHADYVYGGGQQHIVTTVVENAWYGKATSTSVASGVVV